MKHMFVILSRNICLSFCHETCLLFVCVCWREKEGNVLFNDALNTFYLRLYGIRHMVKDHSDSEKGNPLLPHRLLLSIIRCHETCVCYLSVYVECRRKEMFYLMMHSTHFIFGYMALDRCHETYVYYFVTKHMFVMCLCMLDAQGRKCFI